MSEPVVKYGSTRTMNRIADVIRDADTPAWLPSVPHNFGHAAAGSLKADEWRTMATVYLPLVLISEWGEGSTHVPPSLSSSYRRALDHTMDLVCAITLACRRTMMKSRMDSYLGYILSWVGNLQLIHPEIKFRVNGHMAIHIYQFLKLFGPVRSWWCFPFERLIGHLQRLPSNNKFGNLFIYPRIFVHELNCYLIGELEATMLASFTRIGKLKRWIARPDCPIFLKECNALFNKAFGNGLAGSLSDIDEPIAAESAFETTPIHLQKLITHHRIAFRARYTFDNVIFSRVSTHVGNSLILYHPDGDVTKPAVPASIKYIIAKHKKDVVYAVNAQLPAPHGTVDPYRFYPDFLAKVYSTELSPELHIIQPDWVTSHYARWSIDEDRAVVLALSRVCKILVIFWQS